MNKWEDELRNNHFNKLAFIGREGEEYIDKTISIIQSLLDKKAEEVAREFVGLFGWVDQGLGHGHIAFGGDTDKISELKQKYIKE